MVDTVTFGRKALQHSEEQLCRVRSLEEPLKRGMRLEICLS